jgi:hypothetical protein
VGSQEILCFTSEVVSALFRCWAKIKEPAKLRLVPRASKGGEGGILHGKRAGGRPSNFKATEQHSKIKTES